MNDVKMERAHCKMNENVESLSWMQWASEVSARENGRWKIQKTSKETGALRILLVGK